MKHFILLSLCLTFSLLSCSDDDNTIGSSVSGKINESTFEYKSARVSESLNGKLLFEIFNETAPNPGVCGFVPQDIRIFFSCEDTDERQDLFLDLNNFEGFTVTLFDPESANNIIATEGYFQITDRNALEISGTLDVRANSDSFVKGDFTARLCD